VKIFLYGLSDSSESGKTINKLEDKPIEIIHTEKQKEKE
jgi:hypothetical protein